jgi:MerR family transcriptional regulator/heat shock protein HspR
MSDVDRRPVYTMQVAVSLLRAHPQTLRNYERAGLIRPERSAGKQRLYSAADIQRLAHLLALAERHKLTKEMLILMAYLHGGLERLERTLAGPPEPEAWATAQHIVRDLKALLEPQVPATE